MFIIYFKLFFFLKNYFEFVKIYGYCKTLKQHKGTEL